MDTPRPEEPIGDFTLYRRENRDTKGPFYVLSWHGAWLPGTFANRDAALIAVGIITGGEGRFYLDDLRQYANQQNPDTGFITVDTIMSALTKATNPLT